MAQAAGAMAVASSLLSMGQAVHGYQTAKQNARREGQLAELRAEDRREQLRRTLAAQRVALVAQGRDPDVGSGLGLQAGAVEAAAREQSLDRFQTRAAKQQHRAEGVSALLGGVAGSSRSLLAYGQAKKEASR